MRPKQHLEICTDLDWKCRDLKKWCNRAGPSFESYHNRFAPPKPTAMAFQRTAVSCRQTEGPVADAGSFECTVAESLCPIFQD